MKITSVFLITGFLGSGKTTFLTQAIRFYNGKKKIGVIQNEFAPANLDGKELIRTVDQKFDLLEINNGSAFCVCLLSDFLSSLEQFITQYQPDILFIEASGLSDPDTPLCQIHNPGKRAQDQPHTLSPRRGEIL